MRSSKSGPAERAARPSWFPSRGVKSRAFCADAEGAVETRVKTKTVGLRRISWRSLLLWIVPILAFAWLAIAARAGS